MPLNEGPQARLSRRSDRDSLWPTNHEMNRAFPSSISATRPFGSAGTGLSLTIGEERHHRS